MCAAREVGVKGLIYLAVMGGFAATLLVVMPMVVHGDAQGKQGEWEQQRVELEAKRAEEEAIRIDAEAVNGSPPMNPRELSFLTKVTRPLYLFR